MSNKSPSSFPFKSGNRTISSAPKKNTYSRGTIPLDCPISTEGLIQFKFMYFKESSAPSRCICQQTPSEREELDHFFSQYFCRSVQYFQSKCNIKSSGIDSNVPKTLSNKNGPKESLHHFHVTNKYCIHGFFNGNNFFVVSLDPDHAVNPSRKS